MSPSFWTAVRLSRFGPGRRGEASFLAATGSTEEPVDIEFVRFDPARADLVVVGEWGLQVLWNDGAGLSSPEVVDVLTDGACRPLSA